MKKILHLRNSSSKGKPSVNKETSLLVGKPSTTDGRKLHNSKERPKNRTPNPSTKRESLTRTPGEAPSKLEDHFKHIRKEIRDLKQQIITRSSRSPSDRSSIRSISPNRSGIEAPLPSLAKEIKTKPPTKQVGRLTALSEMKNSGVLHEDEPFYYDDSARGPTSKSTLLGEQAESMRTRVRESPAKPQSELEKNSRVRSNERARLGRGKIPQGLRPSNDVHNLQSGNTPTFIHGSKGDPTLRTGGASRATLSRDSGKNSRTNLRRNDSPSFEESLYSSKSTAAKGTNSSSSESAYFARTIKNLNGIIEKLKVRDELNSERIVHLQRLNEKSQGKLREMEDKIRELQSQPTSAVSPAQQERRKGEESTANEENIARLQQLVEKMSYKISLLTEEKRMLEDLVRNLLLERQKEKLLRNSSGDDFNSVELVREKIGSGAPLSFASLVDKVRKSPKMLSKDINKDQPAMRLDNFSDSPDRNEQHDAVDVRSMIIKRLNFDELTSQNHSVEASGVSKRAEAKVNISPRSFGQPDTDIFEIGFQS